MAASLLHYRHLKQFNGLASPQTNEAIDCTASSLLTIAVVLHLIWQHHHMCERVAGVVVFSKVSFHL